ncbi:MAG: autotransporter domain-containing protein, partial [Phycisphaerales bacterium]|nr:autotransporter domain-containing protein [Phycisphaerales bacterium]
TGDTATFTAATVSSTGQVTVGNGYNFTLADASTVLFNDFVAEGDHAINFADSDSTFRVVGDAEFADGGSLTVTGEGDANFGGDATFLGDFTADVAADSSITFGDSLSFLADKSLTVANAGTLNVSGASTFEGAFSLLVNDATTVEWSGSMDLADTFVINTTGVGDATVDFSGPIRNAGGVDDVMVEITTDGSDDVRFSNNALAGLDGTVQVNGNSAVTFEQNIGPVANDGVSLALRTGAEVRLESLAGPGVFSFKELNDWVDPVDPLLTETGTVTQVGLEDTTLAVTGGTFSGAITDELADLSLLVSAGEFNYSGDADYDGSTSVSDGGTLNLTGSIDGTETLTLERSGTLEIGAGGSMTGSGNVDVKEESVLNLLAGDLAGGDDATFTFTATNDERMNIAGSVSLSSTGDGVASLTYGSNAVVDGSLTASNNSEVDIAGSMEVTGLVDLSGTSAGGLTVDDGLDIGESGQVQLAGSRTLSVTGDSTVAANANGILLNDTSAATFDGDLDNAGTISLNDASTLDVTGDFDLTGNSTFAAGTTLSVGGLLDLADGAMLDLQGTDLDGMDLTATGGILVNSGATLMGNATINTSQLEYGGKVIVGATGSTTGLLTLDSGNLVSDTGGELTFGLTGDLIVGLANDVYGQNSLINVANGTADFTDSGSIMLEVQGTTYIPTDREFTIIETSGGITGDTSVTTNRDQSITRGANNGAGGWATDADALSIWAQSSAQYTNTLSGPDFETGLMLDSFIPFANTDPGNSYGQLLGQLDQIDNAAAYAAAVEGLGPTVQVSTIQLATNTQYFEVLRSEIRRRYATVKQRTPAPFRLSNGTEFASSQDQAAQAKIRRNVRQPSTAEGFGVFWGRDLDTPDEGDIAGISGNEYGGLGGFAWDLNDQWVAGVNLGYSQLSGDVNGGFGTTRVGTVRGGGFVSWFDDGGLFFDVELAGAWNHYDFSRFVPNTGLNTDSTADGFQFDFSAGGGYRVELGESWAITPEASVLYSYVSTGDINEDSSSAAALSISPGDLSALVGRAGGTLSWSALPGLVLDGSFGWQGNFNFNGDYTVGLTNQKAGFKYVADDQTINTAYYGIGVNWSPAYNVNVSVQYEGRNGEGFNSNMLYGGVSIGF